MENATIPAIRVARCNVSASFRGSLPEYKRGRRIGESAEPIEKIKQSSFEAVKIGEFFRNHSTGEKLLKINDYAALGNRAGKRVILPIDYSAKVFNLGKPQKQFARGPATPQNNPAPNKALHLCRFRLKNGSDVWHTLPHCEIMPKFRELQAVDFYDENIGELFAELAEVNANREEKRENQIVDAMREINAAIANAK